MERNVWLISADAHGGGMGDESLKECAWEAMMEEPLELDSGIV